MDQVIKLREQLQALGGRVNKTWGPARLQAEIDKRKAGGSANTEAQTGEDAAGEAAAADVELVAAAPREPAVSHTLELPEYMHDSELCTRDTATLPGDVRAALSGLLCTQISVQNGVLSTADGRVFTLRRAGSALELLAGEDRPA